MRRCLRCAADRTLRAEAQAPAQRQQMSVADLVLKGHSDLAEFALGVSSAEPLVASGGRDTNVRCTIRHIDGLP